LELFFFIIFQKEVDQPTIQYRQVFRYCRHPGDGDSFFPVCSDSVKRLDSVGDAGDVIDQELKKGTRLPGTLRLYLSSLVRFLEWVSGSGTWLRHLRMSSNEVVTDIYTLYCPLI
jgi:hypothetical protein